MKIISDMIELNIFRIGKDGLEYLLLKRSDKDIYPGLWQMVTGHIDKNESAVETALRELKEETGLFPMHLWVVPNVNSFYSADSDCVLVIPVFVAQVDEEVKVTISDEHTEYLWRTAAETKKLLAWDGQRKSVELIEEYFLNELNYLQFTAVKMESFLKKI